MKKHSHSESRFSIRPRGRRTIGYMLGMVLAILAFSWYIAVVSVSGIMLAISAGHLVEMILHAHSLSELLVWTNCVLPILASIDVAHAMHAIRHCARSGANIKRRAKLHWKQLRQAFDRAMSVRTKRKAVK